MLNFEICILSPFLRDLLILNGSRRALASRGNGLVFKIHWAKAGFSQVSKCATHETYIFLFFSVNKIPASYPASLPWVRFGKCISGCGVPVHRRHPSPLSGGPLWQTRAAPCSPITKLVIQPSTQHQRHRDAFSISYHWYFDEKILQLCYGNARWTSILVLIIFISRPWMCRCGSFPGS